VNPDLNKTCSTCLYWTGDKNKKQGSGHCKRYPPLLAGMVQQENPLTRQVSPAIVASWPTSAATEWCGEWTVEKVILQ
jgi:hypothetical protein